MSTNKSNPSAAQRVTNVEYLKLYDTYQQNITTTAQTFEELFGEALQDNVGMVEVLNNSGTSIYFGNGTTSTVTTSKGSELPTARTYAFYGRKDELDEIKLIAGSSLSVSFIQNTSI